MSKVEAPPDATVFTSGGESYFLYLGPAEMVALQREWGLHRKFGESREDKARRLAAFELRLGGEDLDDRITIFRFCLSRWANASGNGSGPIVLTDALVSEILERADLPSGRKPKKFAPAFRLNAVWNRFQLDMLGVDPDEAQAEDPKATPPEGSTPNGS